MLKPRIWGNDDNKMGAASKGTSAAVAGARQQYLQRLRVASRPLQTLPPSPPSWTIARHALIPKWDRAGRWVHRRRGGGTGDGVNPLERWDRLPHWMVLFAAVWNILVSMTTIDFPSSTREQSIGTTRFLRNFTSVWIYHFAPPTRSKTFSRCHGFPFDSMNSVYMITTRRYPIIR